MAERRMFAKTIIDSDAFLDMPISARLLYYDLSMRADDEGFVNSPKKIMRMVGASEDDLRILSARKFIIPFESGIVVIKHWKIHNYIRNDRIHETKYIEEKSMLALDEKGGYSLCQSNVRQMVDNMDTEVRLGKDRLGKDSIDNTYIGIGNNEEIIVEEVKKDSKSKKTPLELAVEEFVTMRNKIKKPLTAEAKKRMLNKLDKMCGDNEEMKIKVLNQSVDHCWQDIYELKEEVKKETKPAKEWDEERYGILI